MFATTWPVGLASWLHDPMALRIDVQLPGDQIDADLERLYHRIHQPGTALHAMPTLVMPLPGLVLRYREADGEYYVYVEDIVHRRLAGYVVFNRLVELNRLADRYLRGPHARFAAAYRRRGLATAIYRCALDAGLCLISGPRQSAAANGLWQALSRHYELGYARLRDKTLHDLGPSVASHVLEDFHTRAVLVGKGWSRAHLMAAVAGAQAPPALQQGPASVVSQAWDIARARRLPWPTLRACLRGFMAARRR